MFDAERQIRFLYPPVFFFASLLLGIRLDSGTSVKDVAVRLLSEPVFKYLKSPDLSVGLSTIVTAAGLVTVVAAGFLISSLSVLILRAAFALICHRSYETGLSRQTCEAIRTELKVPKAKGDRDALYLSATLDHGWLPEGIHKWILRRWSIFYVASNSATALVCALGVGAVIGIWDWRWLVLSLAFIAVFGVVALFAWRETMGMLEFQAKQCKAIFSARRKMTANAAGSTKDESTTE